jgi:hypothetical protein
MSEKKAKEKILSSSEKQHLLEFYKVQRDFLEDLNNLDWRVALIFVPFVAAVSFVFSVAIEFDLKDIGFYTNAVKALALISYSISVYGLWTVTKNQFHAGLRWQILRKIEDELGYKHLVFRKTRRIHRRLGAFTPRRVVLWMVYLMLGWMCYSIWISDMETWDLSLNTMLVPLIVAGFTVLIHYTDHYLYLHPGKQEKTEEAGSIEQNS